MSPRFASPRHSLRSTAFFASACLVLPSVLRASGAVVGITGPESGDLELLPSSPPVNLGGFDIAIIPGPGLSGNAPALAAFNRAAAQWEAYIADPIQVTINADLLNLGSPTTIGSASPIMLSGGYTTVRNQMVADAANEADDAIVASLPTAAQYIGVVPNGVGISGNISATKANFKAMGFPNLDIGFGISDGTINFNSTFLFDYDNSNGVSPGTVDFETVAAHEIGHALGFISAVDDADSGATTLMMQPWDLFRFRDGDPSSDPDDAVEFTFGARSLLPGSPDIFDDVATEGALSTGVNLGDGRQASHWKADELTGNYLGILDPTLANGVVQLITALDLRVLDVIGYEIDTTPVPEASSVLSVLATGALAGGWYRRRARSS